jgi:hypothetical protein
MSIPVWLTVAIAILVIVFGIHRLRISMRTDEQEAVGGPQRKGLYGMSRRAHRIIGLLYLGLGGLLIATSLGWSPFASLFGPGTETPTKDTAPTKTNIPIETTPPAKK